MIPVRRDEVGAKVVRWGESDGVDAGVGMDESPTEDDVVLSGECDVSVACLLISAANVFWLFGIEKSGEARVRADTRELCR